MCLYTRRYYHLEIDVRKVQDKFHGNFVFSRLKTYFVGERFFADEKVIEYFGEKCTVV